MTTDTLPKSQWGPGPWQDEPDESRWTDRATGLRCAILRSPATGALWGYVEIDHPSLCRPASDLRFDIHGGVVYAGLLFACDGETGWWIGFACEGIMDDKPAVDGQPQSMLAQLVEALNGVMFERTYRSIGFVRAQCASLARQVRLASRRLG